MVEDRIDHQAEAASADQRLCYERMYLDSCNVHSLFQRDKTANLLLQTYSSLEISSLTLSVTSSSCIRELAEKDLCPFPGFNLMPGSPEFNPD